MSAKPAMQVVIPMTGIGKRFLDAGYALPKPLLDVGGKPVIAHLTDKFPKDWRFVFVCNSEHLEKTSLRKVLMGLGLNSTIVSISPHKLGPVHAVLQAEKEILDDLPTIVNYCDFSFVWDPEHFLSFVRRTDCDGAILCYRGFHPHYLGPTMYAYCRESEGLVREVKEKECFTDNRENEFASSGSYYFKSGALVKSSFRKMMEKGPALNGEYYVSLVYNHLIRDSLDVRVYEIPYFLQWGTPEDLEDYLYWHEVFKKFPDRDGSGSWPRLLMPMAGFGKRFESGGIPKPLIPVLGRPMFQSAADHLPAKKEKPVFVVRRELSDAIGRAAAGSELVVLNEATQGQADTCRRAKHALKPDEPVLVSSCDHGLLWDRKKLEKTLQSDPDVVVFGQRNYPGARRDPKAYAYIVPKGSSDKIESVSVKKPVSPKPQRDLLLVGTFYFRTAKIMLDAIDRLIKEDVRVNGELYLDSVVNLCVDDGLDVRVFGCDGYLCWGTPDALKEFNYWHNYFMGLEPPA